MTSNHVGFRARIIHALDADDVQDIDDYERK